MSLFIGQANLCFPKTKTTEMVEISLSSLFCLFLDIFEKKCQPKYQLFETDTQKKADTGRYRYFGTSLYLIEK